MRFGVLGSLEVVGDDGDRRDPTAGRQRQLLLALLVRREPVHVDRLVDVLWGDGPQLPRDPAAAVRTYVTRLRQALEPERVGDEATVLVGGPDRFHLCLDGHELDALVFEDELVRATAIGDEDPAAALRLVEAGLGRWRGPAFAEVAERSWVQPEAVRLEERRLAAQELRFRWLLRLDRYLDALADLERYVREHPLRERAHGQLMVALFRSGRSGEAAEVFLRFRARLIEDLGLDPSAELEQRYRRLLDGRDPAGPDAIAASGVWNELPATRTPLVGREDQVQAVGELLRGTRLVTLSGVGGVGKTRLAIAVAHRLRGSLDVAFVDLADVSDRRDVVDAVFASLRLPAAARSDHLDGLVRVLRSRAALLVLDNCEHVVGAVADVVDRLTRDCPDLTVLSTSREAIGIDGEHTYHVPSLSLADGVELFVARSAATGGRPATATEDRRAVEEICRRLDGIPLAIELAAARTSYLTPAAIVDRLDERFWLLGGRRAFGRHQTLQATMDWSYDLLDEDTQAVLRGTAVFTGGFDAEALAAVMACDERESLDHLGTLVRSSLAEVDVGTEPPRYRLLETVRLYAGDRLVGAGELVARRRAHARHFLTRALDQPARFDDLPVWAAASSDDADLSNQLSALDWFGRHGALTDLGRLAARIPTVLGSTGFVDADERYLGRDDVAAALAEPGELALYLVASAANASFLGRFDEQHRLGEAALLAARHPVVRAAATLYLANACTIFAPQRIPPLVEQALRVLPLSAATIRQSLRTQPALGLVMEQRLREAAALLEELVREQDGFAAAELMLVWYLLGEPGRGLAVPAPGDLDPSQALWDYRRVLVRALVAAADERSGDARKLLRDAADHIRSSPRRLLDTDVLLGCAALAHHEAELHRAVEILAACRAAPRSPASFALYTHYRDLLRARVPRHDRAAIIDAARGVDPADLLDRELTAHR
jgi:predicted ATPase/DNA-binding SARP family transcriptional activator